MIEPIFHTTIEEDNSFGKFTFEPLHPSFGHSLGNALRRTLLSSLQGAVVTQVKIEGAPHLFSTVKGVKESALDLVMNLKRVRFKANSEGPLKISISQKGTKKITGKAIEGEADVVNKDHYLAEITDAKGNLELEAIVETGLGFVSAEEQENVETGFIAIDSSFSPIIKVNFKVQAERVGRKSNFERLVLEVWTDGSITPKDAIAESLEILKINLSHIFSGNDTPKIPSEDDEKKIRDDAATAKLDEIIIDELNLPSRVINALLRENIETVADLIKRGRENLTTMKGVGRKSIDLIDQEFKKMGIELK